MEQPVVLVSVVWSPPPHIHPKPPQDFGVELHVWLVVWSGGMNSLRIIPSISKSQISIDFTLLSLASLSLEGVLLRFRFVPINPTFITSYDLGKEVCVDPDLLLKFFADFQPMLLLIISQHPGHGFCRNLPHVEFIYQNALSCPCDSSTMLQTSWIICLWPLQITSHSFAIFSGNVPLKSVWNVHHLQLAYCHF